MSQPTSPLLSRYGQQWINLVTRQWVEVWQIVEHRASENFHPSSAAVDPLKS